MSFSPQLLLDTGFSTLGREGEDDFTTQFLHSPMFDSLREKVSYSRGQPSFYWTLNPSSEAGAGGEASTRWAAGAKTNSADAALCEVQINTSLPSHISASWPSWLSLLPCRLPWHWCTWIEMFYDITLIKSPTLPPWVAGYHSSIWELPGIQRRCSTCSHPQSQCRSCNSPQPPRARSSQTVGPSPAWSCEQCQETSIQTSQWLISLCLSLSSMGSRVWWKFQNGNFYVWLYSF